MPSGYVCSNCGAPISPAQNRCHQCGAEIDWEKAVGRVSYINHLPDARKRSHIRRLILISALLLIFVMGAIAYWGWRSDWIRHPWGQQIISNAYITYQRGMARLESGQSSSGSDAALKPPTTAPEALLLSPPASTPTPTSTSTPTAAPLQSTGTAAPPTVAFTPTATPAFTPLPEDEQVQGLLEQANQLLDQDPCRAADLLQQAIDLEDTPAIETLRQAAAARCQHPLTTPAAPFVSPLPTPKPQKIAFTAYDTDSQRYAIRTWQLGDQLPGQDLALGAMQPAFGPHGVIAFRAITADSAGLYLLQPDGNTQPLTEGEDDSWPRWGPGGQQILFTSAQRSPDGNPHIYLVDITSRTVEDLGPGQHADWAREGQIIFSDCGLGDQACGLWMMDPVTLQRFQITTIPDDLNPVWAPDSRRIAFMSSGRSDSWDVFVIDLETQIITPVAPHPAEDGLPVWSPDGSAVAFLSNRNGDWAIYAWRMGDSDATRLITVGPILPNWQQAGLDWGQ